MLAIAAGGAAAIGLLAYRGTSQSSADLAVHRETPVIASDSGEPALQGPPELPRHDRESPALPGMGRLTEADGLLPAVVSVFDDYAGVANLDADLLQALRRAANAAADDGLQFNVNSGWRSPALQEQFLQEAIVEYGSKKEASRWVATPETSAHVSGDAVDVGPDEAAAWLTKHGAQYGLCRVYKNEPWHFELRPNAARDGCPAMYADPTRDPRMQP